LTTIKYPLGHSFWTQADPKDRELSDRYYKLYDTVNKLQALKDRGRNPPHHWFFGNPTVIQNDPVANLMVERTGLNWQDWYSDAFKAERENWVLLAQFDSDFLDGKPEWEWM